MIVKKTKAFTLIELLISISIISMIAILSISSYPKLAAVSGLTSETYRVLTFLKETQVYGASALTSPGVKMVYGLSLAPGQTVTRTTITSPTAYTNRYYLDNKVTDTYNGEGTLTLKSKYTVSSVCLTDPCTSSSTLDSAYIFYKRPNPDARIVGIKNSIVSPNEGTGSNSKLYITVGSVDNASSTRKIVVLSTGQAYVKE